MDKIALEKGMTRIGTLYLAEMTKTSASKFLHKVCDMAENFVGCKSNIGPPKMSFEMDLGIMTKSLEPWHIDLPLGLNNSHGNKAKLKPFVHGPPLDFIVKLKNCTMKKEILIFGEISKKILNDNMKIGFT